MAKRYKAKFKHCTVTIDHEHRYVQTRFHDGHIAHAVPIVDEECIARARELGYQGSVEDVVWEMTRHHDLLHTVLAEAIGHPWSPTLHCVAHGYDLPPGEVEREERLVLGVQRLLVRGLTIQPDLETTLEVTREQPEWTRLGW